MNLSIMCNYIYFISSHNLQLLVCYIIKCNCGTVKLKWILFLTICWIVKQRIWQPWMQRPEGILYKCDFFVFWAHWGPAFYPKRQTGVIWKTWHEGEGEKRCEPSKINANNVGSFLNLLLNLGAEKPARSPLLLVKMPRQLNWPDMIVTPKPDK